MFNLNSIEYTTKTRYSMFKLMNFYFFGKIIINLEFDGCNTFQRSWDRWPKSLRKLRNAHQTPVWKFPQVNRLIGNRWVPWVGINELLSHSQAKMARGSPLCGQLREKIVKQFKNNVPQRTIARNLGISSSTVHNIIKRFRESGEITAWKRQGRKPTLNARDLRSLRRHCIKNRHQCVKDITTWAQEHFRKPLSVNTVRRYIRKCNLKLYYAKQKPFINNTQKRRRLLWARAHLRWTDAKWKSVLWSDESTFQIVFGKCGRRVLRTKEEKDHPDCYGRKVQKPASVMVWGCVSASGMGNLHICEGTINAERYIQVLEQHMLPSKQRLFHGRPCLFQQDNAKPHSARLTTAWLRSKRVRVLDWPACSPDLSPIENVWRIMKRKIRQRRPRTVEQLKLYIKQEWERIPPTKLQQLVSSVPKRLLSVVKRKGDVTQW